MDEQYALERPSVEKALQESEEKCRKLLEILPAGVFVHRGGRILFTNAAAAKLVGATSPEQLVGKPTLDLVPPDFQDLARERIRRMMEEGREAPLIEGKLLRLDGTAIEVELIATPFIYEGKPTVLSVARDITERRKGEEAREHLHSVAQAASDAIISSDSRGNIIFWNHAAETMFGYSAEEAMGRPISIIVPQRYREAHRRGLERVVSTGVSTVLGKVFEIEGLRKDGSEFIHEITLSKWETEKGIFFTGVMRDITERKRAEEALRRALEESQQRQAEVAALLQSSRTVLEQRRFKDTAQAIFQSAKNLIGANGGYVALLTQDGSQNELVFLDPGDRSCTADPTLPMPTRGLRAEAYRTGKAVYDNDFARSQWSGLLPPGHVTLDNVLFAPMVIGGKAVGLLGLGNKPGGFTENDARLATAFAELTAVALHNSRLRESLKDSEERFRSVVEAASDAIISSDSRGNIIFWNRAAETMFGYSAEEAVGRPISIIVPQRYREAHRRGLERVVSTREAKLVGKTVELVGLRKDGGEFPLELSLASWETREGIFFTAVIRDITWRKRAEEALRRAHDELEIKVQERTAELAQANVALQAEIAERQRSEEALKQEQRIFRGGPTTVFKWAAKENWPVEYVSPNVEQFGYHPDDFVSGRIPYASIVYREDLERVAAEVTAYSESGADHFEQYYRILGSGGETRWLHDFTTVVRDDRGKITHYHGYVLDITRRKQMEEELERSFKRLEKVTEGVISAMARIVESRDPYTAGHQQRVAQLATAIAREMGVLPEQVEAIRLAALIHDIGKVSVPAEILSKPGRLSEIESIIVMTHAQYSYDILKTIEFPGQVAQIAGQHQERINGSGYPQGLRGEDILREARILAVADVVEAMSSHRPYRPALGLEKALEEVSRNRGVLYDPEAVDACLRLFTEKGYKLE